MPTVDRFLITVAVFIVMFSLGGLLRDLWPSMAMGGQRHAAMALYTPTNGPSI